MIYKTSVFINFRMADPANIMFFGNILDYTHDLFEEFIQKTGLTWKEWFQSPDWGCPIRNCQVDYLAPMRPGETYLVNIGVTKIGETSFTMKYDFLKDARPTAQVTLVHTFVSTQNFQKIKIPDKIKFVLNTYKTDTN